MHYLDMDLLPIENINMTALALKYFGYGIPAFALIKILSNFFFARNNTKIPFYISTFIVLLNISNKSLLFSRKLVLLIIPIATIYFYMGWRLNLYILFE